MKVKYLGVSDPFKLLYDKIYDVVAVEKGWYRIVDETGDNDLYPPETFEIINSTPQSARCHDCGKRLTGAGIMVTTNNGNQRQVCEYCARFYKD